MLADRIRVALTIAIAGTLGASLFAARTLASDESSSSSAPKLVLPAASEPLDVDVKFEQRRHTGIVPDWRVIDRIRSTVSRHVRRGGVYVCFRPAPRDYLQREIDVDVELEEMRARALEEALRARGSIPANERAPRTLVDLFER